MLTRRRFLLAAASAIAPVGPRYAFAQTYPSRPLRVIVGFTAASAADITTRLIAERLAEQLRQPVVIDNRPGAASNLSIEMLVKAPADGYTLGLVNVGNAIGATLYERLAFDIRRDIEPVAAFVRGASVMAVSLTLPVKTLPEFIAYAKANPGKLNMASGGTGTVQHVAGELFKMMAGVDMLHVPYRGTPAALTDIFGGRAHVIFDNLASSIEHIRAGRLRALAVTTSTRSAAVPDVPPISDVVPGFEASTWSGLAAPRGTPDAVVAKLNETVNAALSDSQLKARLGNLGASVMPASPREFGKLIADETKKWAAVVKLSGAQAS